MTENIKLSVNDIVNISKRKELSYAVNCWVPSLNREVKFKEFNTSQQKRLVKSVIDSSIYNTEFTCTLTEIFMENCIDTECNVKKLTILDKLLIALNLRMICIGPNIDITVNTASKKEVKCSIELIKVYELAKSSIQSIKAESFVDDTYIVECNIPTIETEYRLEKELRNIPDPISNKTEATVQDKDLQNTIGSAFTSEIVKYLSNVTVKNDLNEEININWDKMNFKDKIIILESMNIKLLKKIINYISSVKAEVDKIELIKFSLDNEVFERRLSIDGNFFMIS